MHQVQSTNPLALAAVVLVVSAASCAKQDPLAEGRPPGSGIEADSGTVARLEGEARALVRPAGCDASNQCLAAGVGARPCGGPRDYVVYCARTTDTAALHRKLEELRQAEMAWNRKQGLMSTCEFREPPRTELVAGACRAAAP